MWAAKAVGNGAPHGVGKLNLEQAATLYTTARLPFGKNHK